MPSPDPRQGEIWWVELDPIRGSELAKTRPAVVFSGDRFHFSPIRLIVPMTTWQPRFAVQGNKYRVEMSIRNGLTVDSAADIQQIRSVSIDRFRTRLGLLEPETMEILRGLLAALVAGPP